MVPEPMNPYESPQVDPFATDELEQPVLAEDASGEKLGLAFGSLFIIGLVVAASLNDTVHEAVQARQLWFGMWPVVLHIIQDASGFAALGLLLWRKFQGRTTFPRHAGHWLLVVQGASFVANSCYVLAYYAYLQGHWEDPDIATRAANVEQNLQGLSVFLIGISIALAGLAAWQTRERLWRRYMLFVCVMFAWFMGAGLAIGMSPFDSPNWLLRSINALVTGLSLVCFLLAVARDYSQREHQDPLHWVGVGCQFGYLINVAWSIYLINTQSR
jgi:hypothetical protein